MSSVWLSRRSRAYRSANASSRSLPSFFFNHTATTEIYTLSLHDALPICRHRRRQEPALRARHGPPGVRGRDGLGDRKSTRLNSSHPSISYAVFCLKKKNTNQLGTIYYDRRTRVLYNNREYNVTDLNSADA